MELSPCTELLPILKGEPDDLYINCISFEERGLKSLIVSEHYRTSHTFIMDFYELYEEKASRRALANRKSIIGTLSENQGLYWGRCLLVSCSRSNPLDGRDKLQTVLRSIREKTPDRTLNITMDISVLTKSYILVFLKELESFWPINLRVIYTQPAHYFPNRLTYGIKNIGYVPMFNGNPAPTKPDLLVVSIGFEGERAFALWEHYEPKTTIAIIEGADNQYGALAIKLNETLLNQRGVQRCEVEPRNPEHACGVLENIWQSHRNYNLLVASLGTKLQAVGAYLFTYRNPTARCQVVYATPLGYLDGYYSKGASSMFEARFTISNTAGQTQESLF